MTNDHISQCLYLNYWNSGQSLSLSTVAKFHCLTQLCIKMNECSQCITVDSTVQQWLTVIYPTIYLLQYTKVYVSHWQNFKFLVFLQKQRVRTVRSRGVDPSWNFGAENASISRGGSMISGALGKISRLCPPPPPSDGPSDDGFQLTLSVSKFTYLINE